MAAFGCALSHDIGRHSGAQKQQGVIREVMSRKKRGAIAGGRQVCTALSGRQGIAAPAKGRVNSEKTGAECEEKHLKDWFSGVV